MTQDDKTALKWALASLALVVMLGYIACAFAWLVSSGVATE